ncbi:MAG: VWA-like domain-containing protein [Myxococcota bacterium]
MTCNWTADLQPLPDTPIADGPLTELAWDVLYLQVQHKPPWETLWLVQQMEQLAGLSPMHFGGVDEMREWCEAGLPLKGLRRLHPARPHHRLGEDEVEMFLVAVHSGEEDDRALAWRLLVTAGQDPTGAHLAMTHWWSSDGVLPNGQWISDEQFEAARRSQDTAQPFFMFESGVRLYWSELRELCKNAHSRKIQAIKDVRNRTGAGLKECKNVVEAWMAGRLKPMGHGEELSIGLSLPAFDRASEARSPAAARMEEAIDALLRDRPLHWVVLSATTIKPDRSHSTMAVGTNIYGQLMLFYSPAFVLKITVEECMGVLVHEINHILFGHLEHPPYDVKNRDAWKLACECSANEFVPYPLPGQPVTIEGLNLPPMESTYRRYQRLKKRKFPTPPLCGGVIWGRLREGATMHTHIESGDPMPPTQILKDAAELVGDEVDHHTLAGMKGSAGRTAGQLLITLEPEGLGVLPWDALLRKRATALHRRVATRRFPSRRFPGQVGIIPGRRRRPEHPTVLAAVDTSGSMSDRELLEIAAELRGLVQRSLRVVLIQCDTRIHEERVLTEDFQRIEVAGRGGTDLRPPLSEEILGRYKPSLAIYFTDGYGPAPERPPVGVDVLWVLTGRQPAIPARYGEVVCMRPRAQRERVRQPS